MRKIRLKITKEVLQSHGIKDQKELAEKAGVRESTVSDIVRGTRSVINFDHLSRIADALGVNDIRELIDFID